VDHSESFNVCKATREIGFESSKGVERLLIMRASTYTVNSKEAKTKLRPGTKTES